MKTYRTYLFVLLAILTIGATPRAHAQFAVIDVSSIAQLIHHLTNSADKDGVNPFCGST